MLLTGTVGFTAAVNAGYFQVVAYNNKITGAADAVLAEALSASKDYYLAAEIHITDVFGPGNYYIWVKGHPAETRSRSSLTAARSSRTSAARSRRRGPELGLPPMAGRAP